MANSPKDRFDQTPDEIHRIGAHRGPKRRGRGWIALAWALLTTGVLVFGGLFALSQYLDDDLGIALFATPQTPVVTPEPDKPIAPITDPATIAPERALTIDVFNGTPESGLQNTALDTLAAQGWPVGSAANASARDIQDTYIYYSNPADEDVASGLALALGKGEIRFVEQEIFPAAPITIVLGADYITTAQ